jgi:hypothetical protein
MDERLFDVVWKWTKGELAGTEYRDKLSINRILDRIVLEGPFIIKKATGGPIILEQINQT